MEKIYQYNDFYVKEYDVITNFECDRYIQMRNIDKTYREKEVFYVIKESGNVLNNPCPFIISEKQIVGAEYPQCVHFLKGYYTKTYEDAKKLVEYNLEEEKKNLENIKI